MSLHHFLYCMYVSMQLLPDEYMTKHRNLPAHSDGYTHSNEMSMPSTETFAMPSGISIHIRNMVLASIVYATLL